MRKIFTQGFSTFLNHRRIKRYFERRPLPGWLHLWNCYLNPFNVLLTVLAVLSFFSGDAKATVVIAVMVTLSTVIRFVQEGRSHNAAESLRAMVSNKATVIRRNGDAASGTAAENIASPLEQRNLLFMGTSIVSGTATALVIATGPRSYFGTLAAHANALETAPNAFQAGVNSAIWLLIRFAAVMVPIVFFINGFTKGDWLQAFLFALSVAVGLTPEMLPIAATPLLVMTLAIMGIGLWLPLGPLAGYFKLQALPLAYYGWLAGILLGYGLLTTLMKRLYIRRYGWQ